MNDSDKAHYLSGEYRADIDGLRAIAVISVVLFHMFPKIIPGGFTGVDIFFVISGFLISGIVVKAVNEHRFTYSDFYARRIKRIFPALLVALLFSLILGWFVLFADEYKQLGSHVFSGITFMQNFTLWQEASYFDNTSETKPLLHLWSLSIEEQFYLAWPLVLILAAKMRRQRVLMWSIAIISFGINVTLVHLRHGVPAFYSPLSRFWEILVGAILAEYSQEIDKSTFLRGKRLGLSLFGLMLLGAAFALAPNDRHFPGLWALLPTVGTGLIISCGTGTTVNEKLLAHRILVFTGLCSYPLYLWHWPLLSFARIIGHNLPSPNIRFYIILVSFILAWLTYVLLEHPIRFNKKISSKKKIWGLSTAMILVAIAGLVISLDNGIQSRQFVQGNPGLETSVDGSDGGNLENGCGVSSENERLFVYCQHDKRWPQSIALIGDSKATALVTGMVRKSDEKTGVLIIGGHKDGTSPLPILTDDKRYSAYQRPIAVALDAVSKNSAIKVVVLTAATRVLFQLSGTKDINDLPSSKNFDVVFDGLNRVIERLISFNKKVVITVDNPTFYEPKDCVPRHSIFSVLDNLLRTDIISHCSISYERQLILSKKYRDLLSKVRNLHPGQVAIFDTLPLLCDMENSLCSSFLNGRLLYGYTDHISDYGSGLISEKLIPFIKQFGGL